jgi:sugar O-acyltransferase (sialic acid O-acetyltransferase NeuD family)
MIKTKKLLIFGDSAFAEVAYEYFTHDSEYEVAAFVVSEKYKVKEVLFGLPVIAFEHVESQYSPNDYYMHVALVYNTLNRIREHFYNQAKLKGYKLANYISSKAFLWRNVELGDNVFIFEDNTVQPFVKIGSNVVLWSGNHIGHHSVLGNHLFISSHVVISGFCSVGDFTFIGVNATIGNNINIGKDCLIGAGCLIVKDTGDGKLFKGTPNYEDKLSIYEKFNIQ